jgi:hypothetical protein
VDKSLISVIEPASLRWSNLEVLVCGGRMVYF